MDDLLHFIFIRWSVKPRPSGGDISDLAGSLSLVNVLFEDADWSSTPRSCEVGGRPQSALPILLPQIRPFLSEHSAGPAFQRVDQGRHRDFRRVLDQQMDVVVFSPPSRPAPMPGESASSRIFCPNHRRRGSWREAQTRSRGVHRSLPSGDSPFGLHAGAAAPAHSLVPAARLRCLQLRRGLQPAS